jgi:hypothetical protein
MRRTSLTIAILVATSFGASAIATQTRPTGPVPAIQAKALGSKPQSVSQGREALDSAVAAAVVGALSEQFSGRTVSIKMDKVDVQPSSIRDRIVNGEGRLQIGGDEDWIGFRFRTLYDTALGNASYPELTLGGISTTEREVPNDSLLVRQLDENVVGLLGKEFGHQAVRLQLDRITTVEAGKRYLRISATGIADFGREGTTPAQVEALYDRRDSTWLRVNYELGSTANRRDETAFADGA